MISDKTYRRMKHLIDAYENKDKNKSNNEPPYLVTFKVSKKSQYNPEYGDNRICNCGHSYYRHFDSYERMQNVGCKYCQCNNFIENINEKN